MLPVRRAVVPSWILEQVFLMVIFSIIPFLRRLDCSRNLQAELVDVRCLNLLCDLLRDALLLGRVVEDG